MAGMWDRGVLNASSWHGLEEVGTFSDAASILDHGRRSGAWPVALETWELRTKAGLLAPASAIVASYQAHADRVVGVVGDRYTSNAPTDWAGLVTAAVAAGAKPTGAFSLCSGSKVLATFEVGTSNGLRTQLLLVDSFDGSTRLSAGFTSIRVVCANTLAMAFGADGAAMAQLRHTASLETKVQILKKSVAKSIETGEKVRTMFETASRTKLNRDQARKVFDALFPEAEKDASQAAKTRAENQREEAYKAMALDVNRVGDKGNLATLWNGATYLLDRNTDGTARKTRGDSDPLNNLLFGTRARRLAEIQVTIETVLRDGSVERMTVAEAREHGIDDGQIGRKLLEDMLG